METPATGEYFDEPAGLVKEHLDVETEEAIFAGLDGAAMLAMPEASEAQKLKALRDANVRALLRANITDDPENAGLQARVRAAIDQLPPEKVEAALAQPVDKEVVSPGGSLADIVEQAQRENMGRDDEPPPTMTLEQACKEIFQAISALQNDATSASKLSKLRLLMRGVSAPTVGSSNAAKRMMRNSLSATTGDQVTAEFLRQVREDAEQLCKNVQEGRAQPAVVRRNLMPTTRLDYGASGVETVDKTMTPWHSPEALEILKKIIPRFEGEEISGPVKKAAIEYDKIQKRLLAFQGLTSMTPEQQTEHKDLYQRYVAMGRQHKFIMQLPAALSVTASQYRQHANEISRQADANAARHGVNAKTTSKAIKSSKTKISKLEKKTGAIEKKLSKVRSSIAKKQRGMISDSKRRAIEKATRQSVSLEADLAGVMGELAEEEKNQAALEAGLATEREAQAASRARSTKAKQIAKRAKPNANPAALDKMAEDLESPAARLHKKRATLSPTPDEQPRPKRARQSSAPRDLPVPPDIEDLKLEEEMKDRLKIRREERRRERDLEKEKERMTREEERSRKAQDIQDFYKGIDKKSVIITMEPEVKNRLDFKEVSSSLSAAQRQEIMDLITRALGNNISFLSKPRIAESVRPNEASYLRSLGDSTKLRIGDLANLAKIAGLQEAGRNLSKFQTPIKSRSRVQAAKKRSKRDASAPRERSPSPPEVPDGRRSRASRDRDRGRAASPKKSAKVRDRSPGRRGPSAPRDKRVMI